ncbi:MAG: HpcH/HpaI aldolase family protein [Promethearchaeota archaeon]
MFDVTLRADLEAGKVVTGTMLYEIRNPLVIPLLHAAGFDFVVVDFEHGTYSHYDLLKFALAARGTGMAVLARPPGWQYEFVAKLLDAGAHGVLVPRVETPGQAGEAARHARYPPAGDRGYGPRDVVTGDFSPLSAAEKVSRTNEGVVVLVQVEREGAVGDIDAILEVPGVDGVVVGPSDLSLSLGVPGQFRHETFECASRRVVEACKRHGVPYGIHAGDLDLVRDWGAGGATILMYSSPWKVLANAAREARRGLS